MTSRERLINTIRLGKVDRVPVSTYELCGFNSHGFENNEPSYRNLMDYIRGKTDCVCMWDMRSNEIVASSSYSVRIDTVQESKNDYTDTFSTIQTPSGTLTSTCRVYDKIVTVWRTEHWCKSVDDVDKYMSIPFEPIHFDDSDYDRIRNEVGERGIIMSSISDPVCQAMELMTFGEATVWAMTETAHYAKTLDEIHRRNMINLENMLKCRTVDLYRICGPEYLTPPYLPPSYFHRFVTPYVKDMTALIHRYGGLVRIHSHGRINQVLEDILSCGADALDPCEAPPDGDITLYELKKRAGKQLCLFGNLQLKMLEHADTHEVRDYVRRCMEDAKEGGGYVIMPTAAPINIPLSSKTEDNYYTFIDTALEYGAY